MVILETAMQANPESPVKGYQTEPIILNAEGIARVEELRPGSTSFDGNPIVSIETHPIEIDSEEKLAMLAKTTTRIAVYETQNHFYVVTSSPRHASPTNHPVESHPSSAF